MRFIREKPYLFRALALALASLSLLGCRPQAPPQTDPARILEWTLGARKLASPPSPDAALILIPGEKLAAKPAPDQKKPSQPATRLSSDKSMEPETRLYGCSRATSVLPAPQDDGRIFLVVDGTVHLLHRADKTITPLGGVNPVAHVTALLASRVVPDGLELLASVRTTGKSEPEIHGLLVNSTGIVRWGIADLPFKSASELSKAYFVPRCSPDGRVCIKISNDGDTTHIGFVDVDLEVAGALDAAWVTDPDVDRSMYVLKACQ